MIIPDCPDHEFEKKLVMLSIQRDTVDDVIAILRDELPLKTVVDENTWQRRFWVGMGIRYRKRKRVHEALRVFHALNDRIYDYQKDSGEHIHKGEPLYQIAVCHSALDHPVTLRRYMMLALCEDAVAHKGTVNPYVVGTYRWLVGRFGFRRADFERYVSDAWKAKNSCKTDALFPEWMLQELDHDWQTTHPTLNESSVYSVNQRYIQHLLDQLGCGDGKALERLAHYLIGAMPGCRAYMRKRSYQTDYDVVGVIEGQFTDFRSEIGRYFLCECKDWKEPADFTTLAKFCRVLDSTRTTFGILFSKTGVTGEGRSTDAEREMVMAFHQRGISVVVVSEGDLKEVAQDVSQKANFITMLRDKYERRRFDLRAGLAR